MTTLLFVHLIIIAEVSLGVFAATRTWQHQPARWFLFYTIANAFFSLGNAIQSDEGIAAGSQFLLVTTAISLTALAITGLGLMIWLFVPHWWERGLAQWLIIPHVVFGGILVLDMAFRFGLIIDMVAMTGTGPTPTGISPGGIVALALLSGSSLLQIGILIYAFIRQRQHRLLILAYAGAIGLSSLGGWLFGVVLQRPDLNTLLMLPIIIVLGYGVLKTRLFSTSDAAVAQALASISDALAITDQRGQCLYANSQASSLSWAEGSSLQHVFETDMDLTSKANTLLSIADRRIDCTRTPVYDKRGRFQGTILLGRDITELERRSTELEQERSQLATTLHDLSVEQHRRETLAASMRMLALPVIPILEGVLVIPLVGEIDAQRASEFSGVLLQAIERERARLVLIDITGVPLLDTNSAAAIIRTTHSARMLGARCMLVGIRPEIAQTLVSLGVAFDDLATAASLQEGLREVWRGQRSR